MQSPPKGYRDLDVWQLSMKLVELAFELTRYLPDDQRFGLISQMQRAAISIPSNIAEGHAKRSGKDYVRHFRIAAGSTDELETQIELCIRLRLIPRDRVHEAWIASQRVAQMLTRLIQRLADSRTRKPKPESRTPGQTPAGDLAG
jgi:four helix bundle protein